MTKHDPRPSQEEIVRCLSEAFKVRVTPDTPPGLLPAIEGLFEDYFVIREGKALEERIAWIDNCMIELGRQASPNIVPGELQLKDTTTIRSNYIEWEEKGEKARSEIICALIKYKEVTQNQVQASHPVYRRGLDRADDWLTYELRELLGKYFHTDGTWKTKRRHAVSYLLHLWNVEEERLSTDTISQRIRRWEERM